MKFSKIVGLLVASIATANSLAMPTSKKILLVFGKIRTVLFVRCGLFLARSEIVNVDENY